MTKHIILFLAANPSGTDQRALDQEASSIRKELKRSGYRDRFELVTRWAVEPYDLLRELRELKPAVIHFSGRGGHDGLFFQTTEGRAKLVTPAALAETFGAAGTSVKLVVLSACYSDGPAEALLAHVDCIVGMGGALQDDMARAFAIGFYGALGDNESVAAAYRHGNAAISLEGLSEVERPQLRIRNGVDAAQFVLATIALPARTALPCPYPGMRPYTADDADHFHCRGVEIEELLGRLRAGARELYVIGPSGSGKSSLVAAGVLPRLARGVVGIGPFLVRSMRPGEHPAARLGELLEVSGADVPTPADAIAVLLAGRARSAAVLIVIDQLEELFTLADPGEKEQFLIALRALRAEPRCVVVSTLRADFFAAFMESPLWTGRRGRPLRIEVDPLRGEALCEAIARPARDVGVVVEADLIERLRADAGSEPGVLPLLQETLVQLWDRRQGQALTLADYQALGTGGRNGLAVALSRHADTTLRALPPAQERIARRILLRLVSFGEGRSDTRRQQPRSRLRATGDDLADFEHVLQQMTADRLLTADDDDDGGEARVDLAHEAMITAWPTLAGWLQTHRADEQRRRQLEAAAARWVEHGRGVRGLLDPIELIDAEAWQRTEPARELGQSPDIAVLVAASRAAHDQQRRRRRGFVWGAFATLAVFAGVVAILAVVGRQRASEAEASRKQAEVDRLKAYLETGRRLLLDGHPQEAMPYLMTARFKGENGIPLRMMLWMVGRSLPLVPPLEHQGLRLYAVFSSDGTRILTDSYPIVRSLDASTSRRDLTDRYQTARIWDAGTGLLVGPPIKHKPTSSVRFSPDGTRVLVRDITDHTKIWDVTNGQSIAPSLNEPYLVIAREDQITRGLIVNNNVIPRDIRFDIQSDYGNVRIWDIVTAKALTPLLKHPPYEDVVSVAFNSDGTRIVTASDDRTSNEGHTRVWDATTGQLLVRLLKHQGFMSSAVFSPDGKRVVTASGDQTARVWDATTGLPITPPLKHQSSVSSAAFSPDGTRVVTASDDHTAQVWNAATGLPLALPFEHQEGVRSAAFSPDGTRVVTTSHDHTARIWNAVTAQPPPPLEHQEKVWGAGFSPDGAHVVTASSDHTSRVWNAATSQPLTPPLKHPGQLGSVAFSPDGTHLVTGGEGQMWIWDAVTGKPLTPPLKHRSWVDRAMFSPDGARIVIVSTDKTAQVWDVATAKPLDPLLNHQERVNYAVFSPDGTRIVTTSTSQTPPYSSHAWIWNAATGKLLVPSLELRIPSKIAAFSPDGTRLVTVTRGSTAQVWDVATALPLAPPIKHRGMKSAAFSPNSTRIVTASLDNTARIWDVATSKQLVPPLQHQGYVNTAEFSPDGTRIVTASSDKTARIWDAATGKQLAPPFTHQDTVTSAEFSPDGTHVVTSSFDKTARVWEIGLDETPPAGWPALAARSPFVLSGGVHVLRSSLARGAGDN
jgi:WD40 repeat protein